MGLKKRARGIYEETRGRFVVQVCRLIQVLDFGRILAAGTPAQIQRSAAVRAAYLGGAGARR